MRSHLMNGFSERRLSESWSLFLDHFCSFPGDLVFPSRQFHPNYHFFHRAVVEKFLVLQI